MARVLTGIQSSGKPHLGNLLGAIVPAIELSKNEKNDSFFFIADYHSLTTIKDGDARRENVNSVAAAWLSFGFDTSKNTFYRQSKIPEVCELAWYLNCYTPYPMLANAHSFKDKSNNLSDVNGGLFTYPVLMAADILLYDANIVPVGKDQQQHIEITRDIARAFNSQHGDIFTVPEAKISSDIMLIPGIDGRKMSKSYNNTIDIFLPEKTLKKQVMKIETDSKGLDEPKDPESCNVFKIFELLADAAQIDEMRSNYLAGGYGYGHAKKALLQLILDKYEKERGEYEKFISDKASLEAELNKGEEKAREVASVSMDRVRSVLGF